MSLEALRTRTSDACVSDLQLDRLIMGELYGEHLHTTEQHLAGCPRCQARRSSLEKERALFFVEHPALSFQVPRVLTAAPRTLAQRWRGVAAVSSGVLLAAASLLLFLRTPQDDESLAVRTKGNQSRVGFYVRHASVVRRGQPGEHVAPQDALRFVVTSQQRGFWAILSRDAAGKASLYFPSQPQAAPVAAGVERALETSVVLDAQLGPEQLYALCCERAIELTPLIAALERGPAEPAWPAGCHVERVALVKEAAR
ncbi:MAG: hypothetical protein RL701_5413 [Pseudomonadota bacterium]|jgi:anti-sigma factor RsiW